MQPSHPDKLYRNKFGYISEFDGYPHHRRLYEEVNGKVPDDWHVHHIDCVKDNNALENLIALPKKFHKWLHRSHEDYLWLVRNNLVTKELIQFLLSSWEQKKFTLSVPLKSGLLKAGILRIEMPKQ